MEIYDKTLHHPFHIERCYQKINPNRLHLHIKNFVIRNTQKNIEIYAHTAWNHFHPILRYAHQ